MRTQPGHDVDTICSGPPCGHDVATGRSHGGERGQVGEQLLLPLCDYTVVVTHPISVRFRDLGVAERLKREAGAQGVSISGLAEELIDEGLRMRRHPLVGFRDGPAGRRACLIGGPDIWEVIGGLVAGDVAPLERVDRAVELFGLRREEVEAALAYYAEFTDEIDATLGANQREAEKAEALWRRQRDLLAG